MLKLPLIPQFFRCSIRDRVSIKTDYSLQQSALSLRFLYKAVKLPEAVKMATPLDRLTNHGDGYPQRDHWHCMPHLMSSVYYVLNNQSCTSSVDSIES